MLEPKRQQLILDLLDEKRLVTVQELTEVLNASEATIRRDLLKLAKAGKLKKIHGGAERAETPAQSIRRQHIEGSAFLASKERNVDKKRAIAKKAVELCDDGDSIIINGGSSTYMMSEFLTSRQLNILTNSYPLAIELVESSENRITLPGGELYRKQNLVLSAFDNDTIPNYHGRFLFMGTPGLGKFGVMESDPLLIRAEQKLMRQTDKLVVMADSSKLGLRSNFILCNLDKVDILITDSDADSTYIRTFEEHGIEIIIA